MWGMELHQLISFGRQLGLAVMGAASLWGMIFLYLAHRKRMTDSAGIFLSWMALRMRWLVVGGGLLGIFAWFALTFFTDVNAHEGVTLVTIKNGVIDGMLLMTPVYIAILVSIVFAVFTYKKPLSIYNRKTGFSWFYLTTFILASIAISYYTDLRGLPVNETVFHIFHGFHSIFTLGTVLCLDVIFLSTQGAPFAQKHIFPLFPQISKVIWAGLSLDLISTLLIYPEAVALTPRFYFAQTVVGILIINGILLSGVITRRMLQNIEEGHKEKTIFWEKFATVAGAISITSWTAITFVDNFHDMNVSLGNLFLIYVLVIISIIFVHEVWNKLDTRAERIKSFWVTD